MTSRKVLRHILQKPLGPYYDHDILDATKCQLSMKHGCALALYSFILEHNGHIIGLDQCERPLDHGPDNRKFRFRGLLKIPNPDWLSDFGVKTVELELNLRADERALREGERRQPPLTVKGLFESKLLAKSNDSTWDEGDGEVRLVILIQGEKNLPAVFMQSAYAPNGLLWSSKAHNRNFRIATMNVETYSKSENFFWRWRLLKLMEKIAGKYSHIHISKRTPKWFVDKYMSDFATPAADEHRRIIYDEDDSDVDERGMTKTPRHLLRPHTSEVLGLFAAQSQWLVTNAEVRSKKLFDLSVWMKFARDVRRGRKEAAAEGMRWGLPIGEEEGEEESEGREEEVNNLVDEVDEMVRANPVIGKTNGAVARKLHLAQKRADRERKQRVNLHSDPIGSSSASSGDEGGATCVSDFSESSDAVQSDSDGEERAPLARVPWQLQISPPLPDADGRWLCPRNDCKYQIDLHNLTEDDGRQIPQNVMQYIVRRQWRNPLNDKIVLEGLARMVTRHYMKHYNEVGVKFDGKRRVAWVDQGWRRPDDDEVITGPMPAQATLGGELRVIPTVHIQQ